jgi:hypothetical protein
VAGIVAALILGAATLAAEEATESTRPIANTLTRIEMHIREIEAPRQHMMGGLEQQLGALSRETVALSQALRVPNARGRWGELTLRRMSELGAGGANEPPSIPKLDGAAREPQGLAPQDQLPPV